MPAAVPVIRAETTRSSSIAHAASIARTSPTNSTTRSYRRSAMVCAIEHRSNASPSAPTSFHSCSRGRRAASRRPPPDQGESVANAGEDRIDVSIHPRHSTSIQPRQPNQTAPEGTDAPSPPMSPIAGGRPCAGCPRSRRWRHLDWGDFRQAFGDREPGGGGQQTVGSGTGVEADVITHGEVIQSSGRGRRDEPAPFSGTCAAELIDDASDRRTAHGELL